VTFLLPGKNNNWWDIFNIHQTILYFWSLMVITVTRISKLLVLLKTIMCMN